MNALNDGTLLARWRDNRDSDAFAELARRHTPVVFDITRRVLGERSMAEDVVQEALLDLALETTQRPAEVGVAAWLIRFAVHRARDRRTAEMRRTMRQTTYALERPEELLPDAAVELEGELQRALGSCSAEERALLALRFLHGWEYAQIAAALSIREVAARVRLHRALSRVRSRRSMNAGGGDEVVMARGFGARTPAALSPDWLDASLRAVLRSATLRLDRDGGGQERSSKRSLPVAVVLGGVVLLFVTAVAVPSGSSSAGFTPIVPTPPNVAHRRASDFAAFASLTASMIVTGRPGPTVSSATRPSEISCANSSR